MIIIVWKKAEKIHFINTDFELYGIVIKIDSQLVYLYVHSFIHSAKKRRRKNKLQNEKKNS